MADLGFVGLGVMGGRIARRLLAAGHAVTGYNRTKSKAEWLIQEGLRWADSPREVVEASEMTFSMVTGTQALEAITEGPHGILAGLSPRKLYVDMSTVSPAASRGVAAEVRERGARMLDCPVSGSVVTLEEGRLSLMVGGEAEDVERARPILEQIGPKVTHVGENGQAVLMKIATNLSLAVQMLRVQRERPACGEGRHPQEDGGRGPPVQRDHIADGGLPRPVRAGDAEEAWFDIDMMQKDLPLALEAGRGFDVPLPTTAVTNELLTAARALGMGRQDFAVLFEVLARMAGVED